MAQKKLEFKDILRLRRTRIGATQMEIAVAAGLKSGVSCADWEAGDGMPEAKRLKPIAQRLSLGVAQLLGEAEISPSLLFESAAAANAYGFDWQEPIKPPAPQPFEPAGQEPGRFLLRVNLEDCELLTAFNQMDARGRRTLLNSAHSILRDIVGQAEQAQ